MKAGAGDDSATSSGLMRRSALSFMGGVAAGVFGLLLSLLVGRTFGTEGAGVFFAVVAVVMVVSNTVELGADTGFVWVLPRLRSQGRADLQRRVIRIGLVPVIGTAVVAAAAIFLMAVPLAGAIGGGDQTIRGLQFGAAAVLGGTLATVAVAITRGFGRLTPYIGLQNVALPALRVLGVAVAAIAGWSVSEALGLWSAAWVIVAVVAVIWAFRLAGVEDPHPDRVTPPARLRREFWGFSAPRAVAGVVEIGLVWLDVLLVSILIGPAEAGIYAIASRFVTTGTLGQNALRIALAPRFSALFARRDVAGVNHLLGLATPLSIAFTWPIFIVAAANAGALLSIFGTGFDAGAPALVLLSMAMIAFAVLGPIQPVLLMSGHSGWQLMNKSAALIVMVAVDLVLVPQWGIVGAAVGWVAAMLTDNAAAVVELWLIESVRFEWRKTLPTMVLVGGGVLAVVGVVRVSGLGGVPALIAGAAGAAAWVVLLMVVPRSPISLVHGLEGESNRAA